MPNWKGAAYRLPMSTIGAVLFVTSPVLGLCLISGRALRQRQVSRPTPTRTSGGAGTPPGIRSFGS
eukprot:11618911-Alexandrium_andersonii.AAC.1